jgi:aryl-alcohol dehydrogenase-like predicted oxidoreductase
MEYVNLGRSGLKVSRLCLGMMSYGTNRWREWILPQEEARPFVEQALEGGINFFDTADMYSRGASEEVTGRLLREMAARDDVVVATKVFFPMGDGPNVRGLSRKHIMSSIEASLRRLGMDYVDLYQIHRWDYHTPIDETMEALHEVVRAGKARYIGASSMFAWQLSKALYTADLRGWTRFVSMQDHYNLVYREEEREMLPLCRDQGLGVVPWSPLARGFLAGNRRIRGEGETVRARTDDYSHALYYKEGDQDVLDRVVALAERRGVKPAQIALAWLLHQPVVTAPIVGATKPHHLGEALAALDIELSEEERASLGEMYRPHPVLGHH